MHSESCSVYVEQLNYHACYAHSTTALPHAVVLQVVELTMMPLRTRACGTNPCVGRCRDVQ
jgi:hypothetical protein